MDPKEAETPQTFRASEEAAMETSPPDSNEDAHKRIRADIQALLDDMHTSFQSFSDSIFTKIDDMQAKIDELENSVTNLSVTTTGLPLVPAQVAPGDHVIPSESPLNTAPDLPPPPQL